MFSFLFSFFRFVFIVLFDLNVLMFFWSLTVFETRFQSSIAIAGQNASLIVSEQVLPTLGDISWSVPSDDSRRVWKVCGNDQTVRLEICIKLELWKNFSVSKICYFFWKSVLFYDYFFLIFFNFWIVHFYLNFFCFNISVFQFIEFVIIVECFQMSFVLFFIVFSFYIFMILNSFKSHFVNLFSESLNIHCAMLLWRGNFQSWQIFWRIVVKLIKSWLLFSNGSRWIPWWGVFAMMDGEEHLFMVVVWWKTEWLLVMRYSLFLLEWSLFYLKIECIVWKVIAIFNFFFIVCCSYHFLFFIFSFNQESRTSWWLLKESSNLFWKKLK